MLAPDCVPGVFRLRTIACSRASLAVASALVAGCTTLPDDVTASMHLADDCHQLETQKGDALGLTPAEFIKQLEARITVRTSCVAPDNQLGIHPFLECAAFDLQRSAHAVYPANHPELLKLDTQLKVIFDDGEALKENFDTAPWANITKTCEGWSQSSQGIGTCYSNAIRQDAGMIQAFGLLMGSLAKVSQDLAVLSNQSGSLPNTATQAQINLSASTARFVESSSAYVKDARSAMLGDINVVTADRLISNATYQHAYRIFDLIDHGLVPMEKLLDRADQKVYGAISISMFLAEPRIEAGISDGLKKIVGVGDPETSRASLAVWVPLAIAACERISDPKVVRQSPTLEPMVERALADSVASTLRGIVTARNQDSKTSDTKKMGAGGVAPLSLVGDGTTNSDNLLAYVLSEWAVRSSAVQVQVQAANDKQGFTIRSIPGDDALLKRQALSLSSVQVSTGTTALGTAGQAYASQLSSLAARSVSISSSYAVANSASTASQTIYVQSGSTSDSSTKPQVRPVEFNLCDRLPFGICRRMNADLTSFQVEIEPFPAGRFADRDVEAMLALVANAAQDAPQVFKGRVIGSASSEGITCRDLLRQRANDDLHLGWEIRGPSPALTLVSEDDHFHAEVLCNDASGGNRALAIARAIWAAQVLTKTSTKIKVSSTDARGVGTLRASVPGRPGDRKVTVLLMAEPDPH